MIRRARGCLLAVTASLVAVTVGGVVVYALRVPLLVGVGAIVYDTDPLDSADAIVVLSGGADRLLEAADLFRSGYAPVIVLTSQPEPEIVGALQARGVGVADALEVRLGYLEALGVPRSATTVLQQVVASTHEEATLVAEWAKSRGVERIIIVTTGFHTARARLAFGRSFQSQPTVLLLRASRVSEFDPVAWWHDRQGVRTVLIELQKQFYYRVMYWLGRSP